MSVFSAILKKILDDPGLWTRAEWAEIFNVKESQIEDWLADLTIPSPSVLDGIIRVASVNSRFSKTTREEWDKIASRPAVELSPHGKKFGETLRHYMLRPLLEGFHNCFDPLPPEIQEEVLYAAAKMCHEKRLELDRKAMAPKEASDNPVKKEQP